MEKIEKFSYSSLLISASVMKELNNQIINKHCIKYAKIRVSENSYSHVFYAVEIKKEAIFLKQVSKNEIAFINREKFKDMSHILTIANFLPELEVITNLNI